MCTDPSSKPQFIGFPPVSSAEDSALVTHLTKLINTVYTIAEKGIFYDTYARTDAEEVRGLLRAEGLALASTCLTAPFSKPASIIGCIRVVRPASNVGGFGTLVAAPEARGSGVGRQLVDFAEAYCRSQGATQMQLELLVPTDVVNHFKAWIQAWYEKLGYRIIRIEDFGKTYPKLAPHVCAPVEYRIFQKTL